MKLIDRHPCEGTGPAIYIGHREYRKPDGKTHVSRTWYAEWCLGARHCQRALGTTNKQVAIRKAHDICRSIQAGEGAPKTYKLSNAELKNRYMEVKRNEGRAPKTLEKCEYSLQHFADWCERSGRASAVRFGVSAFRTSGPTTAP